MKRGDTHPIAAKVPPRDEGKSRDQDDQPFGVGGRMVSCAKLRKVGPTKVDEVKAGRASTRGRCGPSPSPSPSPSRDPRKQRRFLRKNYSPSYPSVVLVGAPGATPPRRVPA